MKTLLAVCALAGASGCASTLTTLQTARPVEPKHVQVNAGTGFYGPLGPVVSLIGQGIKQGDAAMKAANGGQPFNLSEEDVQELLTAGLALAVTPPSQGYELSLRTGLIADLDVGLRYSVTALRVDTKYRFFHRGDPLPPLPGSIPLVDSPAIASVPEAVHSRRSFDMALGLGISRHFFQHPALDLLGVVQLDDFARWDVEAPLYVSAEVGEFLKLYGAAKYIYSRTSLDAKLVEVGNVASGTAGFDLRLPSVVNSHFAGATAGIALGYRWVHLWLELTGGYTFMNPTLFGRRRDLGGITLYPAAAISFSL